MKGSKVIFVCSECGATSPKWLGKCQDCGSWNTFEEIEVKEKKSGSVSNTKIALKNKAEKFTDLKMPDYIRTATGMHELDRVLGGGLVDSSVVLLSGEPGIGKSTLLLQICRQLSETRTVLYVSGEESQGQLKLRAERLNITGDDIYLLTETDLDSIISECDRIKPDVIIMDSIQTV